VADYRAHDRVVCAESKPAATLALLQDWWQAWQQAEHNPSEDGVVLAYRRAEVDRLNVACQQLLAARGRLGPQRLQVEDRQLAVGDRVVCGRNAIAQLGWPTAAAAPSPPWTPRRAPSPSGWREGPAGGGPAGLVPGRLPAQRAQPSGGSGLRHHRASRPRAHQVACPSDSWVRSTGGSKPFKRSASTVEPSGLVRSATKRRPHRPAPPAGAEGADRVEA
jgi:hypothetical protein